MSNYTVPLPTAPPPATAAGVGSEVEAELAGQTAPLETEAAGYQRAQERAMSDLQSLFGGILPFVQGSAQRVAEAYGASTEAQKSIFNQAWMRMNELRSQRAGEAQALAQQLGAPIPIDMFTKGVDLERSVFVPEAAGELLKATGLAQAGVQEAEAFAGRVFPLKQARMYRETRNYYQDKIWELKKQIASIKGMKKGMVNERLRQRQLEDYQMRLDRAQAQFQEWSTKQSLKLEQKRLNAQLEEIRGNLKLGADELALKKAEAKTKQNLQQQYVAAKKEQLIQFSGGMFSPEAKLTDVKTITPKYDPITGKQTGWQSLTETRNLGGQGFRNPAHLLNAILAAAGVSKNQKALYNFAIAQTIRTFRAAGLNIPNDPSKWGDWWKKRQAAKTVAGRRAGAKKAAGKVKSKVG